MAGGTETQLERTLGFREALTIGVGTMVGAGIFVLPGPAAALAGPAAAVAFVAAGGIAVLTPLSASELATAMPASGGPYHFINRGLGPVFGSIASLGNWLGLAFATVFYAVGFGNYVAPLVLGILPPLGIGPLPLSAAQIGGLVAAVLFIGVNYLSTKGTGDRQNVIVIVLLAILGLFILLGVTQADVATLRPLFSEGPDSVFPATALVFVSYLGFAQVATAPRADLSARYSFSFGVRESTASHPRRPSIPSAGAGSRITVGRSRSPANSERSVTTGSIGISFCRRRHSAERIASYCARM